jgi:NAD(P)-dependent dehydrogenase (short-subunit alcohol dehydrogenase family)
MAFCGPAYTTSKWALIGFSKQASLKYATEGIRINVLAPGAVNTPMLRNGLPESDPRWLAMKKHLESMIPSKRIAEPWEMAGPITFLSSDMSSYLYGHVLNADGGLVGLGAGSHAELGQSEVHYDLSASVAPIVSQKEMVV